MKKLKLAVIGCGAIAQKVHLPVAVLSDQIEVTVLVDKFLPRARELADKYSVPAVADDYRDVIGQVDAVIVALPHHLHAPVTIDLLQHGIHTFVEKPMALTTSDCDKMIRMAGNAGAVLAVGLDCRFFVSTSLIGCYGGSATMRAQSITMMLWAGLKPTVSSIYDCRVVPLV